MASQTSTLYQVSLLHALMAADFEPSCTVADILAHGDTGIGTFEGLGGELILIDGTAFNGAPDGIAHPLTPETKVCFAECTHLPVHQTPKTITGIASFAALKTKLDQAFSISSNRFYVMRAHASVHFVQWRSVGKWEKPYPTLVHAASKQAVFERSDWECDFVGFRYPDYMAALNLPGWHIHVIGADRSAGGHLLELTADSFEVQVSSIDHFELQLPAGETFNELDTMNVSQKQLQQVEG